MARRASSVLPTLPLELVQRIIKLATEDLDNSNYRVFCLNAALVHRDWTDLACRQLYEEIEFDNTNKSTLPQIVGLVNSPTLGLYPIRTIFWTQDGGRGTADLQYVLKMLVEREGLKKLHTLALSFSVNTIPDLSITDIAQLVPSLDTLAIAGIVVNWDQTHSMVPIPIDSHLTRLRLDSPAGMISENHYAALDRLKQLSANELTGFFDSMSECIEAIEGRYAQIGLIHRLKRLMLHRRTRESTTIAAPRAFPRLEHLLLNMDDDESRYSTEHFDDWEMPALITMTTVGPTLGGEVFRLFKEWVTRPAFQTITYWNIHHDYPVETSSHDVDWVNFLKTCEARGIEVCVGIDREIVEVSHYSGT